MKITILASSLVALCGYAGAQSYVTSPAGFENIEGSGSAYSFGYYAGGRHMFCDNEYAGTAMTLKGTAVRADNYVYNDTYGMGRSWQNLQIKASEADYDAFSRTFDSNPKATPQLVFSGAVTWPTRTGKPPTFPAAFEYSFPFATPWAYTGNDAICLDYQFAGGQMANNARWTGSTSYRYYFDAVEKVDRNTAYGTKYGDFGSKGGCNDRGRPDTNGGEIYTTCYHYSATYSDKNYRGNVQYWQNGRYMGISQPVVTILGFKIVEEGWMYPGVYCNKVHIDMSLPTLSFFQITSTSGTSAPLTFGAGPYGFPGTTGMAGTVLATQAAWTDPKTKRLMLTNATKMVIPKKPFSEFRKSIYTYRNYPSGNGPYLGPAHNPIVRYTK